MLGVYVAGCAGGHLNPAITFVNCLFRGFPWKKLPIYAAAQIMGCYCGAAIIYGNYKSAIDAYEGYGIRTVPGYSKTATGGIFCTYPQPFLTKTGQVFSEIIASSVLVFCIFAIKDDANLGAGNMVPIVLLFLIFGIGATLGWETGYAINLARDFGPRLLSYSVGYGPNVWRAGDYYFWVCQLFYLNIRANSYRYLWYVHLSVARSAVSCMIPCCIRVRVRSIHLGGD